MILLINKGEVFCLNISGAGYTPYFLKLAAENIKHLDLLTKSKTIFVQFIAFDF